MGIDRGPVRRQVGLASVACLAVALLVAPGAMAQGTEPSGLDDEARAVFQAGQLAFANGRFEVALERFREAYELSARPILLFNIGTAADRLRRDREALDAFERFLVELPDTPNRAEVEARIEVLRSAVGSQPEVPDEPPEPQEEPSEPVPRETQEPAPAEPATPAPPQDDSGGGGHLWTWVALGVGAAAGVGAIILWAGATSSFDELKQTCDDMGGCTDAMVEADWDERGLGTDVVLTNVLLGVGVAGALAAGVLFFVEGSGSGEEAGPQVGLGPGGVVLRGAF